MQGQTQNDEKRTALKGLAKDLKERLGKGSADPKAPEQSSKHHAALPAIAPGQEVELILDVLDSSPYQPVSRSLNKRDVEDLAQAIRAHGQIQPILVSPSEENGRFVIQSGHRRCAALRFLGAKTVRAVVRELSEREARRLVVGDNLGRKDLCAFEKALALNEYHEAYPDLSLESAATELGLKRRTAYRLMSLLKASEALRDIFATAQIPAYAAASLAKIDTRDPHKALQLAERYVAGKITADQLEKLSSEKKSSSTPARKTADLKVTQREVRLTINLTRSQIQLRAAAFDEAKAAIEKFLGHIGYPSVEAADVGEFDAMREVTQ